MKLVIFLTVLFCIGINAKSCSEELKKLQGKQQLLGAFRPRCQADGTYEEMQCHGSTGYCFCVVPESGVEITGTRQRGLKSCKCMVQKHKATSKGMVGAFVPRCETDGTYKKKQCHGSTGFCFCVMPDTGEKLFGTEIRFSEPKSCELTECIKQRHEVLKVQPPLLGAFIPSCKDDGSFEKVQCHEGFCYCVIPKTGDEILGTRLSERGRTPKSCEQTSCFMQRHSVLSAKRPLLGAFKPECNEDGTYKDIQCKEGFCFCADPKTGKVIPGTMQTQRGQKPSSCNQPACLRERQLVEASQPLLGAFKPECNADGTYKIVQCREGLCYCVFAKDGKEILGTRSNKRGVRPKSCKLTKCVRERHNGWKMTLRGLLGVPMPRCDDDGRYSKVQCRKGLCWCADQNTGTGLKNTQILASKELKC